MASGMIPGVALINNFDENGELMRGCLLRIYQAGTNTPVDTFKDSALTAGQEHPWPIIGDAAGRVPMFWLEAGSYAVRLSSSDGGYVAYNIPTIATVGGDTDSGGGGGAVSSEVIFRTGFMLPALMTGALAGFVRMNGRTIGSASSSATERANADAHDLFIHIYGQVGDNIAAVSGGRGANAEADWAANKTIVVPSWQGTAIVGLDGMGNTPAGRLTADTFATSGQGPDVLGALGGAERVPLSVAQLPVHTPIINITDLGHYHTDINVGTVARGVDSGGDFNVMADIGNKDTNTKTTGITATANAIGSGANHNNVQASRTATIYIKL